MNNIYYVYQLRRADRQEPFYIGKGQDDRAADHFREYNLKKHHPKNYTIKKAIREGVDLLVEYLWTGLSETEAFRREVWAIAMWGRKDRNDGPLTNLTDGGEGASGQIISEETRLKRIAIMRPIYASESFRNNRRKHHALQFSDPVMRKRHQESTLDSNNDPDKIARANAKFKESYDFEAHSARMKELHNRPELKAKKSAARLGIAQKMVTCPHCGKEGGYQVMGRWHFDNCKQK